MKNFFQISDSIHPEPGCKLMGSLEGLDRGRSATIDGIDAHCTGLTRRRLLDLGFVPGTRVTKLGEGLFNGPSRFQIRGNVIALRREQAAHILAQHD